MRRAIVKQVIIRTMNNLKELLVKPVWQMTGEEFLFLSRHASYHTNSLVHSHLHNYHTDYHFL